jgi:hypothetical protein
MGRVTHDVAGTLATADDPEAFGPPLLHLLRSPRETVSDKKQNVRLSQWFLASWVSSDPRAVFCRTAALKPHPSTTSSVCNQRQKSR